MTAPASPHAAAPAKQLVAHYELLRLRALGDTAGESPTGYVLFLRDGAPGWLEACSQACVSHRQSVTDGITPAAPRAVPLPDGIRADIIRVLAGMALSRQEARA
jgi:hypothetical protein